MVWCLFRGGDAACFRAATAWRSIFFMVRHGILSGGNRKRMNACPPPVSSKTVCHNGQSAALLSSSGLVMYFSTLPAPSSSAPCILTILTHLRVCVKICILTHPHYKGIWQGLCREWALLLNVLYIGAWANQAELRLKNSIRR